mmetsp:Transcript_6193/g.16196  ORF Transcript_6193/g.16196 Transcript_6193/m.16196 type:complete len:248 (+) Transcript_6193:958-1701(+)
MRCLALCEPWSRMCAKILLSARRRFGVSCGEAFSSLAASYGRLIAILSPALTTMPKQRWPTSVHVLRSQPRKTLHCPPIPSTAPWLPMCCPRGALPTAPLALAAVPELQLPPPRELPDRAALLAASLEMPPAPELPADVPARPSDPSHGCLHGCCFHTFRPWHLVHVNPIARGLLHATSCFTVGTSLASSCAGTRSSSSASLSSPSPTVAGDAPPVSTTPSQPTGCGSRGVRTLRSPVGCDATETSR